MKRNELGTPPNRELESTMDNTASTTPRIERFLISPDGNRADWFHPDDIAARAADWTDCTDMSVEQIQQHVAERQAVRPHIVGVTVGA